MANIDIPKGPFTSGTVNHPDIAGDLAANDVSVDPSLLKTADIPASAPDIKPEIT